MIKVNKRVLARFVTSPRRWIGALRFLRNHWRFSRYWQEEKRIESEAVAFIHTIQDRFHRAGGFAWEPQDFKLYCWGRLLRSEEPRFIVEYGSGSSTAISLQYARKAKAKLMAYEEDESWLVNTRQLVDNGWASDEREVLLASREAFPDRRPREVRYDVDPLPGVDCVLIDGPTLEFEGATDYDAVRVNLFDYDTLPRLVAVDGSLATVLAIRERLGHRYRFTESDFSDTSLRTVGPDFEWFHIFRLNMTEE